MIDFNTRPSKLTVSNDSISRRHVIKSNISSPFEGDLKNEIPTPFQNAFFFFLFHELDPHFKSLQVLENYVGQKNIIHLVIEYDVKEVICLL